MTDKRDPNAPAFEPSRYPYPPPAPPVQKRRGCGYVLLILGVLLLASWTVGVLVAALYRP